MPREGHDLRSCAAALSHADFNPRAPRGARRAACRRRWRRTPFQSTCPARGTTKTFPGIAEAMAISIHVPREGHDHGVDAAIFGAGHISIHVPREGHDAAASARRIRRLQFQSTCPARGTTLLPCYNHGKRRYFNPRAPRGARQQTCTIFSCRFAQELQISR